MAIPDQFPWLLGQNALTLIFSPIQSQGYSWKPVNISKRNKGYTPWHWLLIILLLYGDQVPGGSVHTQRMNMWQMLLLSSHCCRDYSRSHHGSFAWIVLFHLPNHFLSSPFYRWEKWGWGTLNNLHSVTRLIGNQAGLNYIHRFQRPCSWYMASPSLGSWACLTSSVEIKAPLWCPNSSCSEPALG